MKRYFGIGLAWVGATVLSVAIASAAVGGIRDRVVEKPGAIGSPTTTVTTVYGGFVPSSSPATTVITVTTTTEPSVATTTEPPGETSTTVPAPVTTSTSAPPTPTTTIAPTTTTSSVVYKTYDLVGGTVILAVGNGEVNLASATPRAGFRADPEHRGPDQVEVSFESNDHKSKLQASWENGELKVNPEEEAHGDGDGDDD